MSYIEFFFSKRDVSEIAPQMFSRMLVEERRIFMYDEKQIHKCE